MIFYSNISTNLWLHCDVKFNLSGGLFLPWPNLTCPGTLFVKHTYCVENNIGALYRCFCVATILEITRRRDQFHKFDVGCDSVWAEHDNNFDNNHNRVNKQECQKSNPQIAFVTRLRQQDYDQHIPNLSLCYNKRLQNIFISKSKSRPNILLLIISPENSF